MTGGKADVVKIPSGLILFENDANNPKKHDWINSNELIQVGNAWRLTAVPSPEVVGGVDPILIALLEQLKKIDAEMPAPRTGKLGRLDKAAHRRRPTNRREVEGRRKRQLVQASLGQSCDRHRGWR